MKWALPTIRKGRWKMRIINGSQIQWRKRGGPGVDSSAEAYQAVLSSLTANNGKLLQPVTVLEMIKPQLSAEAHQGFMEVRKFPHVAHFTAQGQAVDAELDYGLGSCVNLESTPEGRKKGTISWSGLPNTF